MPNVIMSLDTFCLNLERDIQKFKQSMQDDPDLEVMPSTDWYQMFVEWLSIQE